MEANGPELPARERSFSIIESEPRIAAITAAFSKALGIQLRETSSFGRTCAVAELDGAEITCGFGKGAHARIGALGECVEHLHLWRSASDYANISLEIPADEVYRGDIFARVGTGFAEPGAKLRVLPYKMLHRDTTEFIPFSLINGDYGSGDCAPELHDLFWRRYASSSGTAFGLSFEDALLHAMLEVIERHEISRLFLNILQTCGDHSPYYLLRDYDFHLESPFFHFHSVELEHNAKG